MVSFYLYLIPGCICSALASPSAVGDYKGSFVTFRCRPDSQVKGGQDKKYSSTSGVAFVFLFVEFFNLA